MPDKIKVPNAGTRGAITFQEGITLIENIFDEKNKQIAELKETIKQQQDELDDYLTVKLPFDTLHYKLVKGNLKHAEQISDFLNTLQ